MLALLITLAALDSNIKPAVAKPIVIHHGRVSTEYIYPGYQKIQVPGPDAVTRSVFYPPAYPPVKKYNY